MTSYFSLRNKHSLPCSSGQHLSPTVKNSGVNYHAPSSSKADFQLNLDRPGWKGIVRPAEEWRCELANEVHIIDMVQHVERISRNFHVSFAVLSPIEELPRQVHIQADIPGPSSGVASAPRWAVVYYGIVIIVGACNYVKWHARSQRHNRTQPEVFWQ